jgi:hypothetical protein
MHIQIIAASVSTGDVKKVLQVMSLSIVSNTYGADQVGLISGFVLPRSVRASHRVDEALDFLRDSQADGFVWLHFNLAHVACERWMRANLDLPEGFDEMLHAGGGSTRIEPWTACCWRSSMMWRWVLVVSPMWPPCGWRRGELAGDGTGCCARWTGCGGR